MIQTIINYKNPFLLNIFQLDQVGVIVEAKDFNPERYQIVSQVLFRTYHKQADPTIVLQQFLSLIVSGTCQLPKKKLFSSADYDTCQPFADFQIKGIFQMNYKLH